MIGTGALVVAVGLLSASIALGLAFVLLQSALQSWATELAPARRGVATSFVAGSVFVGTGAGARLADAQHYSLLFGIAAELAVAVAIVGAVTRTRCGTAHQPAARRTGTGMTRPSPHRTNPPLPTRGLSPSSATRRQILV